MKAAILLRSGQKESAFGRYLGEVLRAEGLNWFVIEELALQCLSRLDDYQLILLPRCFLAKEEIDALVRYVDGGGRLVCIRPSMRLGQAVGLEPTHAAQKGGYLSIDTEQPTGCGMPSLSIQIHGMADHWRLSPRSELRAGASLGAERDGPWGPPGLIWGPFGGGQVACFSYDLPATVAMIRQGDPQRANTLTSRFDGNYRSLDLYVGHLDGERSLIPQADVHMALLSNVIDVMLDQPAPRLWYYPEPRHRSVIVMTSDDDWSQIGDFEALMAAAEARGGAVTFFLVPATRVSPEQVRSWSLRGHAFSVHPDFSALADRASGLQPVGLDEQVLYMDEMLRASVRGFEQRYGLPVRTVRHHCVRWHGYTDTARALAGLGVQMDTNNYAGMPYMGSYMAGSGRPLKFVDEDGEVIGIFQQPTVITEDTTIGAHSFSPHWTTSEVLQRARQLMDESIRRFYTPVCVNIHPLTYTDYSGGMTDGILDLAVERGVPVLSADAWLDFTLARYGTEFEEVAWDGKSLSFAVRAVESPLGLTVAVPAGERSLQSASVDGSEQQADMVELFGRPFILVRLGPAPGVRRVCISLLDA